MTKYRRIFFWIEVTDGYERLKYFTYFSASLAIIYTLCRVYFRDHFGNALEYIEYFADSYRVYIFTTISFFVLYNVISAASEATELSISSSNRVERTNPAEVERLLSSARNDIISRFESEITIKIDNLLKEDFEEKIQNTIIENINDKFGENFLDAIGQELSNKASDINIKNSLISQISNRFDDIRHRLNEYAQNSMTMSSKYASYGLLFGFLGIVTLASISIINYDQLLKHEDWINHDINIKWIFIRMGPGFGLVLLCEFLAVYMFRNQTKSIEFARYFANEASSLDSKAVAVIAAVKIGDKEDLSKIIDMLHTIDRNPIIDKDKKTYMSMSAEIEDRFIENISKLSAILPRNTQTKNGIESGQG